MQNVIRLWLARGALCLVVFSITVSVRAQDATTYQFDLPAQPLADALRAVARQTGANVLFESKDLKGITALALRGQLTTTQAVDRLLAGTTLVVERTTPTTLIVHSERGTVVSKRVSDAANVFHASELAWGPAQAVPTSTDEHTTGQANKSPDDQEESNNKLQEITVTAQRRAESLDKVPVSITAISQKTMDDLHLEKLGDLSAYVPGLYVPTSTGSAFSQDFGSVSIRGISSQANAPTTQFYIDETPVAIRQLQIGVSSTSPQPLIFDLDRVEVLRGPQGTLFGASAMGGALRFITPQPNLRFASGFSKAEIGFTDHGSPSYEIGAAYGAPIVSGSLGFRVSAWYQSVGGFIDQENFSTGEITKKNANNTDAWVIRPAFTWAPSEDLTITPAVYLQHKGSDNPPAYWLTGLAKPENGNPIWGGTLQPLTDDLRIGSLAIKYNIGDIFIQADTSYLNRQLQENSDLSQVLQFFLTRTTSFLPGMDGFHANQTDTSYNHAWQQEFRISSQDPAARLNWVAGAFYRHTVTGLQQLWPPDLTPLTMAAYGQTSLEFFGGIPDYIYKGQQINAFSNGHTTDVSQAVFGDVTVSLTSHLKVDVGARVEHLTVEGQHLIFAGPFDGVTYSDTFLPAERATPITPRASLTYQYTDDDMVYINAAKGFRPGGGNVPIGNSSLCAPSLHALGLNSVPDTYSSDSLWSYEIGAKDLLFERRLSIEASAYYIKWSGIQTQLALPSCGQSFTSNSGEAISKGFDLQLAALVTDELKVRALVGYTDAYYPKASYGAPDPNTGIVPLLIGAGDKVVPSIPWTYALNAEYSHDISRLWAGSHLYLRVDYRHLSATTTHDPRTANYDPEVDPHPNPAYGILNTRLGLVRGGLDLSAYINNATNADPLIEYMHAGYGDPLFRASSLQPLTAGLTAWYRF